MKKMRLDDEEQEVLDAFEAGKLQSELTSERRQLIERSAQKATQKDKRINIRISGRDLAAIQRKAVKEGMPYQTLVASVLHKYISGGLHDVSANKKPDWN